MIQFKNKNTVLEFICQVEGWKTRCKNLHWSAPKKNIHEYLDELYDTLVDYQDDLAEGYMGISGKLGPLDVKGDQCDCKDPWSFIEEIISGTVEFLENLPSDAIFSGLRGRTEELVQSINKYKYLFGLC